MAFPTTSILDNFNRTNEGPPPSSNWTTVTWSDGGLKVFDNAAISQADVDGNDYITYWNVGTFGPNVEARFTVSTYVFPTSPRYVEFYLLVDDPVDFNIYYYVEINTQDGSETALAVYLYRETGLVAVETDVIIADGDQWGVEVIDGFVTIYQFPAGGSAWETVLTYDDPAPIETAGYTCIGMRVGSGLHYVIDDFGSGTIESGPVAPTAAFSGTPLSGPAPLTVDFTDESTNDPTSWAWDFGDGGTSTAQNPSHTYTTPGTYTVELVATNDEGSDTETKVDYIEVLGPPVTDFSGTPTSGAVALSVDFTDASTNTPDTWAWDFGDGGTSTSQNPTHVYNYIGTYTVTLTASNSAGSDTETKVDYITVTAIVEYGAAEIENCDIDTGGASVGLRVADVAIARDNILGPLAIDVDAELRVKDNAYSPLVNNGTLTPLEGDRAAFDALNYQAQHANDIDDVAGIHHTLAGLIADGLVSGTGTPGLIPQWDTATTLEDSNLSKTGAGDMVLSAPTNVTVAIDASLEIDPTDAIDGQLLGYDGAHWVAVEPNPNASTTRYRAKTSATSGDPASRYILWNNATQASATELNISNTNDYNRDVAVFLGLIQVDDILILQRESISGDLQRWIVSGAPVDNTTYWTIPVTLDDSTYSFTNNEIIFLIWVGSTGGGGTVTGTGTTGRIVQWSNGPGGVIGDSNLTVSAASPRTLYMGDNFSLNANTLGAPSIVISELSGSRVGILLKTDTNISGDISIVSGKTLIVSNDATVSGTNTGDQTIPAAANPTASVGLTAVNGAAATFMRSDAAPALDVTIAPTWSGVHTFSNTTDSSSTGTGAIVTAGGLGVAKAIYGGSTLTISNSTPTTSTLIASVLAPNMAHGADTGLIIGRANSVNAAGIINYRSDATAANGTLRLGIAGVGVALTIDGNKAVVATSTLQATGGFGCNTKTPQTAYASGGAAPAGGTGTAAGAYDTAAHRDALITLVNNIRAALVANGIMS